jgi:aldehyde dehydrogenase (NAD+)
MAAGIDRRRQELAQLITAEIGSPISLSRTMHVDVAVGTLESVAERSRHVPWTEEIGNSLIVREPFGVAGAITPWNFPLQEMILKVAPAIMAGNAIVLKPSQLAPLTAGILAEVGAEAGVPAGVLNVVHGLGSVVGEAIASHPGVGVIGFTGSTRAGRLVAAVAAETVKRVGLELGGKSANVILDDANLDLAVSLGLASAWTNAGQLCFAWTRMLVPAFRHDEIVAKVVAAAAEYTVGDPTDPATRIGPVASEAQRRSVTGYIEQGVAEGATLVFGGPGRIAGLDGAYVRPTIFADVHPDAVIAQEEIFGPVISIIPYRDDEDAVAIANNSAYGLAGAVFGEPDHALAVARRIQAGSIDINGGAFNFAAPFGGYKQSGNGARELGTFGIEEYLQIKAIQQ